MSMVENMYEVPLSTCNFTRIIELIFFYFIKNQDCSNIHNIAAWTQEWSTERSTEINTDYCIELLFLISGNWVGDVNSQHHKRWYDSRYRCRNCGRELGVGGISESDSNRKEMNWVSNDMTQGYPRGTVGTYDHDEIYS